MKPSLIPIFLFAGLLVGYTTTGSNPVADMPAWMGGLPADAPPRPGTPPMRLGKLKELRKQRDQRGIAVDRPKLTGPHARVLERGPDVGTPMAANLTGKPRLKVRQADVIAPAAGVDHDGMRALIVGAIDDEPGGAGLPHFSEGYLLLAVHGSMVAPAPGGETAEKSWSRRGVEP
jgi:hypothetical protein